MNGLTFPSKVEAIVAITAETEGEEVVIKCTSLKPIQEEWRLVMSVEEAITLYHELGQVIGKVTVKA